MGLATSAKVLTAGAVWRVTGLARAGRTLVDATNSADETTRTLAGMLLAQAGERSVTAIEDAFVGGKGSPELVDVLTSIGSDRARLELESLTGYDGEIGAAARQGLHDLDEMRRMEE